MRLDVDFVQGADILAPGLSRAQRPLIEGMAQDERFRLRPITFPSNAGSMLFPYAYGPLAARLWASQAPLVHIANSWYGHLVPLIRRPSIVNCHDLIELEEMETGERPMKPHRRFHLRAAMHGMGQATFIACDSEATARKVRERLPQSAKRVRVVPCGVSPIFSPGNADPAVLRRLQARPPYVLFVGSEQPRKNLPRLVAAVAAVRESVPELKFVKVGGHQTAAGRDALERACEVGGLDGATTVLEGVADADLLHLYRGAAVTALPSLREGFGYPPLEAMACGCPAVVSDRDSLPEVVGSAASIVDPLDVGAIAEGLRRAIKDGDERRRLQLEGPEQAAQFSWGCVAEGYRALYEEALQR
ncbi:MAG: glycosyltransferase family 4 protein [Chloroflexota bacterium]|nr:glycosyltransferase family 4 protein [Chloroflexota bacterium]